MFDTVFFTALFVLTLLSLRNKNVLSVLIVVMFFRGVQEIVWWLYLNELFFKSLMYSFALFVGSWLWYKTISKVLVVSTIIIATTEIYWAGIGEGKSVLLSFLMYIAAMHLLLHHFIYVRTEIFSRWGKSIQFIPLDWKIRDLAYFSYCLALAVAAESYITYWLNSDFDFLYSLYSYINHIIGGVLIWFVVEAVAEDFSKLRA